ncbi:DUF1302 domain-containing protein [Paraburkholderia sediminicola]|uniref:DUF1302 domain-containing protein n=1 Tax=Paraburkholderia sediminicola TaxID=458836 RepID=UPI0038BA3883
MKRTLTLAACASAAMLTCRPATAYDFSVGPIEASTTTSITGGLGIRTKNPSCSLVGDQTSSCGAGANTAQYANGDDGDLNYKKGQPYTASIGLVTEGLFTLPDAGVKVFVRGSGMYDFAAGHTQRTDLSASATSQAVWQLQLLDAWAQKDFNIAGANSHIRVGNQVINWGESIFSTGGINVTNSYDIQKLLTPGTQLKQALLPAPMVSFASDLGHGFSTEAYYQFGWNSNRFPPVGTYWSASDVLGRGQQPLTLSTNNLNVGGFDPGAIGRATGSNNIAGITSGLLNGTYAGPPFNSIGSAYSTTLPTNNNQYGFRFNWSPASTQLNLAAYYIEYTDKSPVSTLRADNSVNMSYLKNRQMLGVSANFPVGDWAVGWETSYRPHDAVSLTPCYLPGGATDINTNGAVGIDCPLYEDKKRIQMTLNGLLSLTKSQYSFLRLIGADSAALTAEASWIYYPGISPNSPIYRTIGGQPVMQVPDAANATWLQTGPQEYQIAKGQGTASSIGVTLDFNWTYDGSLIKGWQVTPGLTFTDSVFGYTPNAAANYESGAKSLNVYVLFTQNPATWTAGVNYAAYFGGNALSQPYADRNYVGAFLTRTF